MIKRTVENTEANTLEMLDHFLHDMNRYDANAQGTARLLYEQKVKATGQIPHETWNQWAGDEKERARNLARLCLALAALLCLSCLALPSR